MSCCVCKTPAQCGVNEEQSLFNGSPNSRPLTVSLQVAETMRERYYPSFLVSDLYDRLIKRDEHHSQSQSSMEKKEEVTQESASVRRLPQMAVSPDHGAVPHSHRIWTRARRSATKAAKESTSRPATPPPNCASSTTNWSTSDRRWAPSRTHPSQTRR